MGTVSLPVSRWPPLAVPGLVEFAPSVGWFCLMALPLACQYPTLHPTARDLQMGLVAAIALLMLMADWLAYRIGGTRRAASHTTQPGSGLWLIGLCFVGPIAFHLVLMPNYPLLAWLADRDLDYEVLMGMRDASAKFLEVPSLVKYSFNWALFIFAPMFITVTWMTGRRLLSSGGLLFAVFYAGMTLARFPLVMLLIACIFALCVLPSRMQRTLTLALGVAALAASFLVATIVVGGMIDRQAADANGTVPAAVANLKADDPRRAMSVGDHSRLLLHGVVDHRNALVRGFEYAMYRAWLTPSDVSNRWYQYYSYVTTERVGMAFLVPGPRSATTQTPSRLVGVWAYLSRFPNRYNSSISANASFDADAFAHAGVPGVAIAVLLLLATRLAAACLLTTGTVAMAAYGVMLGMLALLPSSASLQAIFGANGLAIVPVLLLGIRIADARRAAGSGIGAVT